MERPHLGPVLAVVAVVVLGACGQSARAHRAAAPAAPGATTAPPGTPATTVTPATPPPTAAAPPATTRAAPPYQVTAGTLPLVDTTRPTVSHGRTLSATRALTTLWWAPDQPGRWPLIVFGHGYQVGPLPYETLLRAWAAAGYVVVAPEFPLADQDVAGANLDENDINNEPGDLRFVADAVTAPAAAIAGRIDASQVIVAGHSDGAEAALAASVRPAPAGQPAWRAVLAMSVQPIPGTLHTTNPPILVTQGDADTINPEAYGVQAWERAASPKFLLALHGGDHLPPLEAGSRWLPAIEQTTLAFFARELGQGSDAAVLAAGNAPPLTSIQAG